MFVAAYFCDAHRSSGDVAIPADVVFRRVRVQVEVLMAGASILAGEAQAEAVARLKTAVNQAGGVFSLTAVQSSVGRYVTPAALGQAKGEQDKAE